MSRYQTRELVGYLAIGRSGGRTEPGLSVTVVDTLYGYQVMGQFRSEDIPNFAFRSYMKHLRHARVRELADELCARLNAE